MLPIYRKKFAIFSLLLLISAVFFISIFLYSAQSGNQSITQRAELVIKDTLKNSRNIKKYIITLSKEQKKEIKKQYGINADANKQTFFLYYVIYNDNDNNQVIGYAVIDRHNVRTLYETVLVIFSPNLQVLHVEILDFLEPEEYLPPYRWLEQFLKPAKDYILYDNIAGITGATLTADAIVQCISRTKAILKYFL